jgi:hypothetical protein
MAPRDPNKRHSVEHPPRPVPKRDADVDVLERPAGDEAHDEPTRGDNGFDPNVNSVPR